MTSKITKDNSWLARKRTYIDQSARVFIGLGGISIIFAIVLIFFYLLWVVLPMFESAEVKPLSEFSTSVEGETRYLGLEESGHIAIEIGSAGTVEFVNVDTGDRIKQETLDLVDEAPIKFVRELDADGKLVLLVTENAYFQVMRFNYKVNFDDQGKRFLIPSIEFPYGEEPVRINGIDEVEQINMSRDDERFVLAAVNGDRELLIQQFEVGEYDEFSDPEYESLIEIPIQPDYIKFGQLGHWLYLVNEDGELVMMDISDTEDPVLHEKMHVTEQGHKVDALEMLLGRVSMIVADDQGKVEQWSLQRDENNNYTLARVRGFEAGAPLTDIMPERRRKGLMAIDQNGEIILYYTTSQRMLFNEQMIDFKPVNATISPRASVALLQSPDGKYYSFEIHNEHPEISWHSLWESVLYEGYTEPQYSWQSSSADNDFEPKFSLMPLTFGTLKAAFYAMMIAVPLAIMGAIYTAYFMAPKMRGLVKPSIEIMEALPTVILGFLAGLWFAPYVEEHLLAILSMLFVLPVGLILFAWLWTYLPGHIRRLVPEGWQAALLIPVIALLGVFALGVAPFFETHLFGGSLQRWMQHEFGIGYDQRNSVVVGIAMGIAVIPTIFSITEDAIFSVPRHLTNGSLALGATPWQTLTRVVILTASPGIFSAVMIGLGRAVGETMIVLMATGNTPVMDMSIFEGMRTLSANIAVELPESEVGSSHYRILFLAALVLFVVTFVFNTAAEVVRQRLRKRYGSL
jgi:phosphate transport system permease protein